MSTEEADTSHWPDGVHPISFGEIDRLGVGPDNRLHWDGRQVETRSKSLFESVFHNP
jgi:hypothetical protein